MQFSLRSKLGRRWIRAFAAILALSVASTAITFVSGRLTVSRFRATVAEVEARSAVLGGLSADMERWEGLSHSVLGNPDREAVDEWDAVTGKLEAGFATGARVFEAAAARHDLTEAAEAWAEARRGVAAYLASPSHSEESETEGRDGLAGVEEAMESVAELQRGSIQDLRSDVAAAEAHERSLLLLVATVVVVLVGMTVRIGRSLTSKTLAPILRLDEGVGRFASGDLDHRVDVTHDDELGALASSFNKMAEALGTNQRSLAHQAMHDPLTGLANRAYFRARVDAALRAEGQQGVSILFIDLDDFKIINDVDGHDAGDRLLQLVSQRLHACCREVDMVARLGGDEFAILIEHGADTGLAVGMAERVQGALAAPFVIGAREARIAASIGIATAPGPHIDPDELLRRADIAMYAAKSRGKACFDVFDTALHDEVLDRMTLRADLAGAADRGEMVVHYQPVYDLRSQQIEGIEALVRWQHPTRGLLMPAAFIPTAEKSDEIRRITRFVVDTACRQVRTWQWHNPEHRELWISINVSASDLNIGGLAADIEQALADSGLPPSSLVLELTETVLLQDVSEAAWDELRALREQGVRVAIDDFGTGFSSLAYLRHLAVDILKIDRSFVSGRDVADKATLLQTILSLGQNLSLAVVAEGIEHPDQTALLGQLGCQLGQGYLLCRPSPPETINTVLGAAQRGTTRSAS